MGDILFAALALMLVIEGLLPFLSPGAWRRVFERATRMTDGQIRFLGLTSMIAGVAMLLLFWP
ncbi:MAG: DUF2065 domain-containing protein [Rhizobacter sp.]|nr:DUF2065 domain-containing protein [Burkholderiaceae bacterium]MCO5125757.1 DUF2065 domain-containing protein [Rhizobacter sp.]